MHHVVRYLACGAPHYESVLHGSNTATSQNRHILQVLYCKLLEIRAADSFRLHIQLRLLCLRLGRHRHAGVSTLSAQSSSVCRYHCTLSRGSTSSQVACEKYVCVEAQFAWRAGLRGGPVTASRRSSARFMPACAAGGGDDAGCCYPCSPVSPEAGCPLRDSFQVAQIT
jgi:hypothetical protein